MKKIAVNISLLLFPLFSWASLFSPDEPYMITCNDTKKGGVEQAISGEYPLIYNDNANSTTEKAFWIITEEEPDKYSFKNLSTNQYIKYAPEKTTEKFVELVNQTDGDNTLFYIEFVKQDSRSYYAILPVASPNQAFDRRSYNAVGPYSRHANSNQQFCFISRDDLLTANGMLYSYLNSFSINGESLVFDKTKNLYYFSILLDKMDTDVKQVISFEPKNPNYILKINKETIVSGKEYTFENVTAGKAYTIEILNGTTTLTTEKIIFSGLPIVQLYTEGNNLSSEFSFGKIRVHEPDKETTAEMLNAEIRYRGATSLQYDKKSFAIKLKDESGQSTDRSYFGLRNDNYWILDAMAMDASRMRNRLCTDLWNDFSSDPYYKQQEPKLVNATRGQYVEVFLDDEYWGLYCMTERIDRKQLKLKKYDETNGTINGVLYKAIQWSYSVMMGCVPDIGANPYYNLPQYYNSNESWDSYEVKYPDLEDGQSVDWKPLYDVVKFVASSSDSNFKNGISQQVDLPVWTDYYLLMELILSTDNHGKNAYVYMYDINREQKLGIAPWDMDGVLGIRWDKSQVDANQDYTNFIIQREHGEHNLFRRLKSTDAADFNQSLKKRYDELRFSHFSKKSITERIEYYKNVFEKSGAGVRETARWNNHNWVNLDFDKELAYLADWLESRSGYLNNYYGEPILSSVAQNDISNLNISVYPNPATEYLYIAFADESTENLSVSILDVTGKSVFNEIYNLPSKSGTISIPVTTLNQGVYFIYINAGSSGKKRVTHKVIINR